MPRWPNSSWASGSCRTIPRMADTSSRKSRPGKSETGKSGTGNSRSRWPRRLAFVALATCAGLWFHDTILRSVAEFLVVDESGAAGQAVLLVGGENQFDAAAQRHAQGAKVVFLQRSQPGRLERLGILGLSED